MNIAAGRSYGITMTIAFALAFIGGILCLAAAGVGLARGRLAWAAITGGVLILLGTLGTFLGYVALDALDESYVGGWVFCFSWIPTLAGVAGHVGRRY
ncbi:hypothetical protein F8O01_17245 [Pseudoclavibacter chungangensis]|uniref:Uncharacterized protein n=1 Tax=Pseudoclavibacter chungangensis TaxID=587635 RepID=A0A7J5BM16_9MICO|nr:hypothetical protein [Pseudoclavibacter chungangensis]KAB1652096.1 hypothetical protein F8O01_17245 [Pseudoclavibacter chungangensis]NYJ65977.1 hypothetical protein [Pseudoclavibacter chungangensis]